MCACSTSRSTWIRRARLPNLLPQPCGWDMVAPPSGVDPRVLRVTCARDGREHLVSDTEMDAGHPGRWVALCGHEVLSGVLVWPPGPPCSGCIAVRWQHTDARDAAGRHPGRIAGRGRWPGSCPGCAGSEDHGEADGVLRHDSDAQRSSRSARTGGVPSGGCVARAVRGCGRPADPPAAYLRKPPIPQHCWGTVGV
jgi:hypothetical protein